MYPIGKVTIHILCCYTSYFQHHAKLQTRLVPQCVCSHLWILCNLVLLDYDFAAPFPINGERGRMGAMSIGMRFGIFHVGRLTMVEPLSSKGFESIHVEMSGRTNKTVHVKLSILQLHVVQTLY